MPLLGSGLPRTHEQGSLAGVSDQEVPFLSCAHIRLLVTCVLPLSHLAIALPGLLHGPCLLKKAWVGRHFHLDSRPRFCLQRDFYFTVIW